MTGSVLMLLSGHPYIRAYVTPNERQPADELELLRLFRALYPRAWDAMRAWPSAVLLCPFDSTTPAVYEFYPDDDQDLADAVASDGRRDSGQDLPECDLSAFLVYDGRRDAGLRDADF